MSRIILHFNEFFARVEMIRQHYSIKQNAFSELTGISNAYYSDMKNGRVGPSANFIYGIVNNFREINPFWLILGEGEMFIGDPEPSGVPALVANELLGVGEVYRLAQELAALPESRRRKLVALFESIIKLEEGEE